jgi:hypothetical protein
LEGFEEGGEGGEMKKQGDTYTTDEIDGGGDHNDQGRRRQQVSSEKKMEEGVVGPLWRWGKRREGMSQFLDRVGRGVVGPARCRSLWCGCETVISVGI